MDGGVKKDWRSVKRQIRHTLLYCAEFGFLWLWLLLCLSLSHANTVIHRHCLQYHRIDPSGPSAHAEMDGMAERANDPVVITLACCSCGGGGGGGFF